ncbi:hypothetical protein [Hymenobacter rubripertinctus]|uniref:Glycosyltransferase RgtA/B/C/D-like domain-containing protein n=1 Tax=Hymenobacter rubripertinctus TaxID=2029981 RepID=A0A418R0V0_9BACT|nr:hypothetical protein [Hymenobacter rubripertinctus]RIY11047.1 hypothetical protein D0T11_08550 [Hymenobacter rubripertinctus]
MLPKIILALLLNAGLLGLLGWWLPRMRQLPGVGRWVLPTLLLKLAVTALSVLLLSEDGHYFQDWSLRMTDQLWHEPGQWGRMLFTDEFKWGRHRLVYHGFSNTLFLIKLLSVFNLASLGAALLNGLYLSMFSFVGCWELVRQLRLRWPLATAGAGVVAFLGWPTVVYWTSGLTKESLLVGSGALVLALVVYLAYGPAARRLRAVLGLLAAALLHFKMRYFFAVVLFGNLAGLGLTRTLQQLGAARSRWAQTALLLALLAAGAWAASEVSPVFRANKFTSQLQRNYSSLLKTSRNRPHLAYPELRPTTASVVQHAPQAIVNALVRPWPWEGRMVLYLIAGLENLLLLLVLGLAGVAVLRGRPGQLPFALVLALLLYCLILAALLGLTTPNLGTLNRYRVSFLPFLVLLLLQNDYAARWLRWLGRRVF